MPWHVEKGHGCSGATPWAVIKTTTGEKVSCHATKAKAQAQVKLLYAKEPAMASTLSDCGCGQHQDGARAAVDTSTWDAAAAMSRCANSDTPASCYGSICAGRKSGPADQRASWALPHHKTAGGPPNAAGVRNGLSRLPQTQGLTNAAAARRHLEAHLSAINAGSASKSADPPRDNLYRSMPGLELREDGQGMPTLFGHFALFGQWNEINSFFEGRFLERNHAKSMDRTFTEDRDRMRVLFQHGRDPMAGDKPLGPIELLEAQRKGPYYEVPLLDTQYNRELLPGLRAGLYGASYRFQVNEENWNKKPEKSDYNPEGIPERTILDQTVLEFGPVTFPAEQATTAGVRSLTDQFTDDHWRTIRTLVLAGYDPEQLAEWVRTHDFTGRPDARSAGGGDPDAKPGQGKASPSDPLADPRVRDRLFRMEGILK